MPIVIKKKTGEVKVREGLTIACDVCGYRPIHPCQTEGSACVGGDDGTYVQMPAEQADAMKATFDAAWKHAVKNNLPLPEKGCIQLHKEGA